MLIRKVGPTDASVLVMGESGTGKELVARAVHACSPRSNRPFIAVNCGAIPPELFESELFGHERGAFTGAVAARAGVFQLASGGTIFLDEIGELPPTMQVKLLRVLQDSEVRPVGSERLLHVDVRIVAATNRNLERDVAQGAFREDLFYRLNVVPIVVPPLRERRSDVATLLGLKRTTLVAKLRRRNTPHRHLDVVVESAHGFATDGTRPLALARSRL